METQKLGVLLTTFANSVAKAGEALAEALEELNSAQADGEASGKRGSGGGKRSKSGDDAPDEDDVIDAVRAAQKVLDGDDIKKLIRKHGKAARASEVEADNRQALLDALEKAVADADD